MTRILKITLGARITFVFSFASTLRWALQKIPDTKGSMNLTTASQCHYDSVFLRVVKGIFVTRDRPFFFPVKCEMGYFFLVNRDFHTSREA